MARFRSGDHEAAGQLVELFYPELRRIAAARMRRERSDHTLQPTAMVHQLYLELVKVKALRPASSDGADEKAAFLGLAAYLMKRLLIHHARPLSKRAEKVELPDLLNSPLGTEHSLLEIDDFPEPACCDQSRTAAGGGAKGFRRPDARGDRPGNGLWYRDRFATLELCSKLAGRS